MVALFGSVPLGLCLRQSVDSPSGFTCGLIMGLAIPWKVLLGLQVQVGVKVLDGK
jgi:hypothetical protein